MAMTPLPDAPARADAPAEFSTKADAFVAALPGFVAEANALQIDVAEKQSTATAAAATATEQAGIAAGQADDAAASAGLAGDYANKTGAAVVPGDYSAKEFASGALTDTGGSAKAWAISPTSPDGTTAKSAKTHATAAAESAYAADQSATAAAGSAATASTQAGQSAAAAAASAGYRDQCADLVASIEDGPVFSVNGKTGAVALVPSDIGAQAALVSGENVKTINGQPVLGAGNIQVGGSISEVGSVITANTTLTAASAGYQPVQMASLGQSITLPDATTIAVGGPRFIIDNTQGGYPAGIRDAAGKLIMAVAAGGEAFVSLKSGATAAGAWSITGTNLEPGLITIDSTFSSTYTSVVLPPYVALDANTSIHFAALATGFAAFVVDNAGKVLTTPVTVTASAATICTAFKISATQAIVFYADTATNTTRAVVLTVSGASPSLSLAVGTAAASSVAGDYAGHAEGFVLAPKIVQLSASLYLYSFATSNTRTSAVAVSVSGTTVTFGAAADVITTGSSAASTTTYALTGTTALVLYRSGTAAPWVNNAVVVSVSGTACTFGSPVALTGCASTQGGSTQPCSALVSPTKCIVVDDNNTTNTVNAVALTISGTSVSAGAALVVETATGIGSGLSVYGASAATRYTPHLWLLSAGATNTVGLWYLDSSGVSRAVVLSETSGTITKGTILFQAISAAAAGAQANGVILPQGAAEFMAVKYQQASGAGYWAAAASHKISGTAITAGVSKPLLSISPSGSVMASRMSSGDYVISGNYGYGANSMAVLRANGDAINYRGDISCPGICNTAMIRNPGVVSANRMVLLGHTTNLGTTAGLSAPQLRLLNVEIAA